MKLLCSLFAVALFVAPVVGEDKKEAPTALKLDGTWKVISGEKFGAKSDPKAIQGDVTISKDTITIKGPDMTHVMTFKLDTKASPIAITMTGKEGPAKDFTAEGIIEIKGDEMKLCYAMPMEKRPTKFESPNDSKVLYFVLKRAK